MSERKGLDVSGAINDCARMLSDFDNMLRFVPSVVGAAVYTAKAAVADLQSELRFVQSRLSEEGYSDKRPLDAKAVPGAHQAYNGR